MWIEFNCKTLGDYHDLYLITDVVLLADVFQTFRKTCLGSYKLDPLHYYTAPGLSWDALLKYTKSDLELLTDMNMHLFIEKGMRGGISMVSKRHAKANNPHVADYNPDNPDNRWVGSEPTASLLRLQMAKRQNRETQRRKGTNI